MENVIIPKFILSALSDCHQVGLVPSIRQGNGGNSHSVWFISFFHMEKQYEVKIVHPYGSFVEFFAHSGFTYIDYFPQQSITSILESQSFSR